MLTFSFGARLKAEELTAVSVRIDDGLHRFPRHRALVVGRVLGVPGPDDSDALFLSVFLGRHGFQLAAPFIEFESARTKIGLEGGECLELDSKQSRQAQKRRMHVEGGQLFTGAM